MEYDEMTAKIAGIIKEWEKLHPEGLLRFRRMCPKNKICEIAENICKTL